MVQINVLICVLSERGNLMSVYVQNFYPGSRRNGAG